jgi:HSP20 family protein
MHDEMDRMFDSLLQPTMMPTTSLLTPLIDVFEKDNNMIVKAEVPGLSKSDLEVTATSDSICLSGEFKTEEETKGKGFIHQERHMGCFSRTIPMPNKIKSDQVKASFKDGVLTITAPIVGEIKPKETKVNIET